MLSTRHINIIKFFLRLVNLESERYASKAFHMLSADADAGHSNWISIARSLVSLYKIQNSDTTRDIKHKVNQHFRSAIMDSLKLHITQEKKLRTYALFKTTFKFEPYLDTLSDFTTRSSFAKLRLSVHSLQIETGRYEVRKTPKEQRYCANCKTLGYYLVEDKVHFLVS